MNTPAAILALGALAVAVIYWVIGGLVRALADSTIDDPHIFFADETRVPGASDDR